MDFKVTDNMPSTRRQLEKFLDEVRNQLYEALENGIKEEVVKQVTDNKNWNPRAVYKGGPQAGQRYDLEFTGQFLEAVRNPAFNTVGVESMTGQKWNRVVLGVGNTIEFDKLVSIKSGKNPDKRYWRLIVYGRESIPGWHFVQGGIVWNKAIGKSFSGGSIAPSEPTYMFDNGLKAAQKAFPKIIQRYMERVDGGGKKKR